MSQTTTSKISQKSRLAVIANPSLVLLSVATVLPACAGVRLDRLVDLQALNEIQHEEAAENSRASAQAGSSTDANLHAESRRSLEHLKAAGTQRKGSQQRLATTHRTSAGCGGQGQRACNIWERIPSCNRGLVENLMAGRCDATAPDGALAQNARAVLGDVEDLLVTLGGYISCFDAAQLEAAVRSRDAAYAKRLERSSCMQKMARVAASRGYQTVSVGISGGGSFVIGGSVDTGFAFDTTGSRGPALYQTKAISLGFQAGGGVGVNIALSKGQNAVNTAGVDGHGFAFEAGTGAGAGAGVWYDYDGKLDGVSVSAIAGASGKAGAYNRVNTSYYDLDGNNPLTCGGEGKRACKLWERVPSCDKGLVEDLLKGRCFKPAASKKRLSCGARNQRPCKLWERVPSCNNGLAENFLVGKCK